MINCPNCARSNNEGTNFCRFCGGKMSGPQSAPFHQANPTAPRPYAWKTDEFQTKAEARHTAPVTASGLPVSSGYNPSPVATQGYHCPKCGSPYLPVMERRISTAGWIVFSVLLITTVIFFWVGLLMKEDVAVCPACRSKTA